MKQPPVKQSFKQFSLVLLAAFAGLFVAELTVRLFSPRYYPITPAAYEYDPDTAFRLRPGVHLFATTDFQQENLTDALGTANFQEGFDGYESLVFAVGDSYTQGTGVPADASYPAQLDFILNRDEQGFYAKRFGVVNLGVAGYGGEQSLINLRRRAARIGRPSVILYLGCDNDFEDDVALSSGSRNRAVIAGNPTWGFLARPLQLIDGTHLGRHARAAYRRSRDRVVNEAVGRPGSKTPVAELELPVLERLESYARENHSLLVVGWSEETQSYSWLKSWAAQRGIPFADWAPRAHSVREAMPRLTLSNQHSGGHHRTWVNQIIATEFARHIRERR